MASKPNKEDSDLPSYYDVVTNNEQQPKDHLHSSVQTSIHDELLHLAIKFNSIQAQKHHQLQQADERALDLLIPQIRTFLTEYSETTLPLATLILVPAGSTSHGAVPADDDLRSADDFGRVVAVAPLTAQKGVNLDAADDAAVWDGEEMARRLAGYLSPKSDELPPRPVQSTSPPVEAASSSKKSFFSWRRPTAETIVPPVATSSDVKTGELPDVVMVVKAEEVVFRSESELGLYESQTVWCIVVRVRVNGGKK